VRFEFRIESRCRVEHYSAFHMRQQSKAEKKLD
jgi:hypothetical protein